MAAKRQAVSQNKWKELILLQRITIMTQVPCPEKSDAHQEGILNIEKCRNLRQNIYF